MAKTPRWLRVKFTGAITSSGNAAVELHVKWWAVPFLFLKASLFPRREVPVGCDGLEVTEVRFGK